MAKPDLCKWWDEERIAAEEAVWQRDRFFVTYANYIKELAKEHSDIKSVIEVGCGMGHVGNELRGTGLEYYGTDGNALMIEKAKAMYPDLNLGVLNIRDLDTVKGKYDVICSFAVLKHFNVSEFQTILRKVLSVTKYAILQFQVRINNRASTEDDFFGPEVAHNWMAEQEIISVYNEEGCAILNPYRDQWKDTSAYIDNSREAVIISQKQ